MKVNGLTGRAGLGAIIIASGVFLAHVSAAETVATTAPDEGVSTDPSTTSGIRKDSRLARLLKEASYSPGVSDVVRLARSGADTPILIAHVQASEHTYRLRPEDIEYLNDNEVPDSVVASMIVRRADLRAQAPKAPAPVPVFQASQPAASAIVNIVSVPKRRVTVPASTVTVIGRSDLQRGLSYRRHFYSARNFYSGTYGRVYVSYDRYSFYNPYHRRGHGIRVCR